MLTCTFPVDSRYAGVCEIEKKFKLRENQNHPPARQIVKQEQHAPQSEGPDPQSSIRSLVQIQAMSKYLYKVSGVGRR